MEMPLPSFKDALKMKLMQIEAEIKFLEHIEFPSVSTSTPAARYQYLTDQRDDYIVMLTQLALGAANK